MEYHLPARYLADLPPGIGLSPAMIADACRALKANRARHLAWRSTESIIEFLAELARNWLNPAFRFRQLAMAPSQSESGFSPQTIAVGLDRFFSQLTVENLKAWLVQDFGLLPQFNQMVLDRTSPVSRRAACVRTPELIVHFTAGTLPVPALMSMVSGLLLGAAQFVKCSSAPGAALLPRLFAHSIHEADPGLGSCVELAVWPGGNESLEAALFEHADCVTASGSDETIRDIQTRVPLHVRFVPYRHRVSFSFLAREALSRDAIRTTARLAAADVAAWDQLGCLSPHVIYAEAGGEHSAKEFAEVLAAELDALESQQPRGAVPPEIATAIAGRRVVYQVRAANAGHTMLWQSAGSTAWTVVFEEDPQFQISCLHRFVYVKGVSNLAEALRAAAMVRHSVSTVGVAAPEHRFSQIALELARWGVPRVCPLGKMQTPPVQWRHDGRPALLDLVWWTDCEMD